MSITTIKIPYQSDNLVRIKEFIVNYNSVLRFTYNRILKNNLKSTKEITVSQKTMNNIFIDSHFLNSAQFEAKNLISQKRDKIIFGGKKLFIERLKNKITSEEFSIRKLIPLCSIGEASNKSNRKFQILNLNEILFKPNKKEHFILTLPKLNKNYKRIFDKLISLQTNNEIAITYKLDLNFIYLSFENNKINSYQNQTIKNRVLSIDLNPNYIGYSIIDWKSSDKFKIVDKGLISIKQINDKEYLFKSKKLPSDSKERVQNNNKRSFETLEISKFLTNLAKHYQCESFSLEKLNIKSSNKEKGKNFNRLCNNNWNRNKLTNNLKKRCEENNIKFIEVLAQYSSFLGNLTYRNLNLPDPILSSIEIGRRGFEFNLQYLTKETEIVKNVIFNESNLTKIKVKQSLEELNYFEKFDNLKNLYYQTKTLKLKYRVLLEDTIFKQFEKKSYKTCILLYKFI